MNFLKYCIYARSHVLTVVLLEDSGLMGYAAVSFGDHFRNILDEESVFETSVTSHPMTEHHIPGDLNPVFVSDPTFNTYNIPHLKKLQLF